jgi:hypothetical protein
VNKLPLYDISNMKIVDCETQLLARDGSWRRAVLFGMAHAINAMVCLNKLWRGPITERAAKNALNAEQITLICHRNFVLGAKHIESIRDERDMDPTIAEYYQIMSAELDRLRDENEKMQERDRMKRSEFLEKVQSMITDAVMSTQGALGDYEYTVLDAATDITDLVPDHVWSEE